MHRKQLDELIGDGEIVTERLEYWAGTDPSRTFLYYGEEDQTLSYGDFNRLANNFAHSLRRMGIAPQDRVSLLLFNPLVTSIAMFGIWKAGAWFCPINFNYTGRLLSYQLNDTAPKTLVTEARLTSRIASIADHIEALPLIIHQPRTDEHDFEPGLPFSDTRFPTISFDECLSGDGNNLNLPLSIADTANIVYTSGTTGPAKGVVQPYRYMNAFTYSYRQLSNHEDVIYNDLPLYHVGGSFFNVNRALWLGCKVALWDKFSPNDFWRRIERCGATSAVFLDVMIPWLMNAPPGPHDRNNSLNKVHMQPFPTYHNDVAKRFGIDFVTCGFGQTESGNSFLGVIEELPESEGTPSELARGLTRHEVRIRCERAGIPYTPLGSSVEERYMGKPLPFHEVSIRDDMDEECEPDVLGHLCLRPKVPHLMLTEYFNKLDATRDVFANQWFHCGDGAIRRADGTYCFVDRIGGFIRVRGENISSYQVEDIVNTHAHIRVSAAFPIPSVDGDEDDLVVYIELQDDKALSEEEFRDWCKEQMPRFMWPRHVRFLANFPRTPTNKVEKYKLKAAVMAELSVVSRM
ncbi:MAG: AMP-binding protein [Chromatiales bacterium]|jgi:carnitine-CoA ligase|nr:AMP-binding protein [Chromatiales bacterium]